MFPYHAERRMWIQPAAKSISSHCKPSISPARVPVMARIVNIVLYGSEAASMICCTCFAVKNRGSRLTASSANSKALKSTFSQTYPHCFGSFMLSNQMRGRAIRVDSAQPQKMANIWHLVCAEPGIFGPGDDYELLVRRCSAFVGVSATAPVIENGTERLGFGHPPFRSEERRV